MRLLDLRPQFRRYETKIETWDICTKPNEPHEHGPVCHATKTGPRAYYIAVDTLAEAQGIEFLCPLCYVKNGGSRGTHGVIGWSRSRGVPDDAEPGPGRWLMEGTSYHDLTLNADPPGSARSIALESGCKWHGFVTNGEVTNV